MNKEAFDSLSKDKQFEWLQAQTNGGRDIKDILAELGIKRFELRDYGFTYSLGTWKSDYSSPPGALIDSQAWVDGSSTL